MTSENVIQTVKEAFIDAPVPSNVSKKKLLQSEWLLDATRHLRSLNDESLPFMLAQILMQLAQKPDASIINEVIEFLDFPIVTRMTDADYKLVWGDKELDDYKNTVQQSSRENNRISTLFSGRQATAFVTWLTWVKENSKYDWWRKDQLESAINYWSNKQ